MPHVDHRIGVVAAAFGIAVLSACSAPLTTPVEAVSALPGSGGSTVALAPHPPPPERAEIPPTAPSPQALWLVGHWSWDGVKFVWRPGRYVERPSSTANWLPGYWEERPDGWKWVDGQWNS